MNKLLIFYFSGVAIALVLFIFLLGLNFIGYGVKEQCEIAQNRYDGDCVGALVQYLDDKDNGYYSRNSVIWALGQLGDRQALPILKEYYTGYTGEREGWGTALAQLELKRAIGHIEGDLNVSKFFLGY